VQHSIEEEQVELVSVRRVITTVMTIGVVCTFCAVVAAGWFMALDGGLLALAIALAGFSGYGLSYMLVGRLEDRERFLILDILCKACGDDGEDDWG
jgi:hypothetical protein